MTISYGHWFYDFFVNNFYFVILKPHCDYRSYHWYFCHTIFISNLFSQIANEFWIGFKASELLSQSRKLTLFSEKNNCIFFNVCHGFESCWKIPLPSGDIWERNGINLLRNEVLYVICLSSSQFHLVVMILKWQIHSHFCGQI